MTILLPIGFFMLTALALLILRFVRPDFRYNWLLAAGGSTLALISIFLWRFHLPQNITLSPWQPISLFFFSPTWLVDEISWPYALSLAGLAVAVIFTSVARSNSDPTSWAGILFLFSIGIMAITAGNPLTLILVWSLLDLVELILMLRYSNDQDHNQRIAMAFAIRICGTGFILWANFFTASQGNLLSFQTISVSTGVPFLFAVVLRLIALHLVSHFSGSDLQRVFKISLSLISVGTILILLAHIPSDALKLTQKPYLIILAAAIALFSSWRWLVSLDEIRGYPYWILTLASFSIISMIRDNSIGSISWGVVLLLSGGLLFLYSARQRTLLWLPMLGIWGLTSLPFSVSASAWQTGSMVSEWYLIPFFAAQGLLIAGYIRHVYKPGETSLESKESWIKVIYSGGLFLLAAIAILLGVWGWEGALTIGQWQAAILIIIFTSIFSILIFFKPAWLGHAKATSQGLKIFQFTWIIKLLANIDHLFRRIAGVFTSSLEGEGGVLWSLLLLTLILSILFANGR